MGLVGEAGTKSSFSFLSGPATKEGWDREGWVKALVAGPLKKELFFAASLVQF